MLLSNDNVINNNGNCISKNAYISRRCNTDSDIFLTFNNNLLKYIYSTNNITLCYTINTYSVDGTSLNLLESLVKDGLIHKSNNFYTKGHISCLYDINLDIPINYYITELTNERLSLTKQFSYLKPNDLIIMDRGYYSTDLIN